MITPTEFEEGLGLKPVQAAKLLGLQYPRWNELKNGTRYIQAWHEASMQAHCMLSKKALRVRLIESGAIPPK